MRDADGDWLDEQASIDGVPPPPRTQVTVEQQLERRIRLRALRHLGPHREQLAAADIGFRDRDGTVQPLLPDRPAAAQRRRAFEPCDPPQAGCGDERLALVEEHVHLRRHAIGERLARIDARLDQRAGNIKILVRQGGDAAIRLFRHQRGLDRRAQPRRQRIGAADRDDGAAALREIAHRGQRAILGHLGGEVAGPDQRAMLIRWTSARLGERVTIPDLSTAGYRYGGGRLVATPHGPAVLLLYDGPQASKLAVLTRPMQIDKSASMTSTSSGTMGRVTWAVDGIGYSVVGERPAAALHPIADERLGQRLGRQRHA